MLETNLVYEEKDFRFTSFRYEHPPHIQWHMNNSYELYYFISGDVTFYIEGQSYKINPNDIIIVNGYELHKPIINPDKPYERLVITFNPGYISSVNDNEYDILYCFEKRKPGYFNKLDSSEVFAHDIDKYIDKIQKQVQNSLPERKVMIKTHFIQMLVTLNNILLDKKDHWEDNITYDSKIISVLEYINRNLNQKITLDILAEELYVNKYYLCHLFKLNTGFTIVEYILHKRIMKAKELLAAGVSLIEACYSSGFNNYSNFYKAFKRITGHSPYDWSKDL